MKSKTNVILDLIISEISSGVSPAKISKKHDIKKQTLQYYLRQLRKKGLIEKVAYGTWELKKEVSLSSKAYPSLRKQIRGHAFNWKVKFLRKYDWVKFLKRNNIAYQLIGVANSTPRIMIGDKKVWLTKTGLVIYEPKSFFARSSKQSYGLAVYELQSTINELERMLKMRLGEYHFTVSREHYGMIKNELARQYNKKGEKLYIKDDGGVWMWIDDSHSLEELETNNRKISHQLQNWYNDHKKHNFEVSSSFILNAFNKVNENMMHVVQNHIYNGENIIKHQKVLDDMLVTLKDLRDTMQEMRDAIRKGL